VSLWGRIFAAGYDRIMAATEEAGLRERRGRLLSAASGRVVELGAGTGANVPLYGPGVTELVLTEPEEPMAKRLRHKAGPSARVVGAPAAQLPFDDASFDTAVTTLVLCTVPSQEAALAEIRRVLKPGGRLLFMEHVRSDDPKSAKWQDRLTPLQRRVGHGCHPNRDTLAAIERAGFTVEDVEHGRIPKAPTFVRPLIQGSATAP
jgi:ubiquinone/menaquinone biosynthesis C-methylase UbiE